MMSINRRCEPERVAPDTWVIRQLFGEGLAPAVYVNSMVIAGPEPVIVDTGPAVARDDWMNDVFSIVGPAAGLPVPRRRRPRRQPPGGPGALPQRHPRHQHVHRRAHGRRLFAAPPPCPDRQRRQPLHRRRPGHAGGGPAHLRQPHHPGPARHQHRRVLGRGQLRRGRHLRGHTDVAELDPDFYQASFLQLNRMLSPWHQWLDGARYGVHLDRVRALGASVVASAHGAALRGDQIGTALDMLAQMPGMPAAPLPGQAELPAVVATFTSPAAGAPQQAA